MRELILLIICMVVLAGTSIGNPLILAPTGTTLTTGQFRAEAALSPNNDNGKYFWLAGGFKQLEINAIQIINNPGRSETIVGLQWDFMPETFMTPAISFGARDAACQSAEGIGIYAAITRHLPVSESSILIKDFVVTAGIGAVGIRGAFGGFRMMLPWKLSIDAEYDSQDFNAAFGWEPVKNLRLKVYDIRGNLYYGAEFARIDF